MKITRVVSILSLFLVLFATSCTIEKRIHLKGYHIEWDGGNKSSTKLTMVEKESIKNDHQMVEISDSVGTLIKNAFAEKSTENQDSILAVIGKLMSSSSEKNTFQANVTIESNSKASSRSMLSTAVSRQIELMQNYYEFDRHSQSVDTTEKTPDYVAPVETEGKNGAYKSPYYSRGARLGSWSLTLLIVSFFIPYLGFLTFIALPFVAIPGIIQSNKEIDTAGTDPQSELLRYNARKGRTKSIVSLAIWGFFVLLAATIIAYTISPV
jgi:hypothetical protein